MGSWCKGKRDQQGSDFPALITGCPLLVSGNERVDVPWGAASFTLQPNHTTAMLRGRGASAGERGRPLAPGPWHYGARLDRPTRRDLPSFVATSSQGRPRVDPGVGFESAARPVVHQRLLSVLRRRTLLGWPSPSRARIMVSRGRLRRNPASLATRGQPT